MSRLNIIVLDEGDWTEWDQWLCIGSCGNTTEYRNRTCVAKGNKKDDCAHDCGDGEPSEEQECFAGCCDDCK